MLEIRVVQDGPQMPGGDSSLRVHGVVVGDGRVGTRLGMFRHRIHGPLLLKAFDRILGPRRRYLLWDQVVDPLADAHADHDRLRFHGRPETFRS